MKKLSELSYFDSLLLNNHKGMLHQNIGGEPYVSFNDGETLILDKEVHLLKSTDDKVERYSFTWIENAPLRCYINVLTNDDYYMLLLVTEPFTKSQGQDILALDQGSLLEALEKETN